MAGRYPGWLIGCGIGCGFILLLMLAAVGAGTVYFGGMMKRFDAAAEAKAALEARFGPPESFAPAPDGALPAERMEIFLSVRDAIRPAGADLAGAFSLLHDSATDAEKLKLKPVLERTTSVLSIARQALGLPQRLGTFFAARERALLDAGMGMGEYTYIYALSYYGLLGHRPSGGPGSRRVRVGHTGAGDDHDERGGADMDEFGPGLPQRLHDELLSMLRNQISALTAGGASRADAAIRAAIEREISAMETDPVRTPWQDGLPERIAASLEPYRARLASTWNPDLDPFELTRNRRRGRWSIQAD